MIFFVVNDEIPSISSEIVEQIEVIQVVLLPGESKQNDSTIKKKQGDQTQFSSKKTLEQRKCICYCVLYSPSHQLMNCVTK